MPHPARSPTTADLRLLGWLFARRWRKGARKNISGVILSEDAPKGRASESKDLRFTDN